MPPIGGYGGGSGRKIPFRTTEHGGKMSEYYSERVKKSDRIDFLKKELFREMPHIEADRAVLLTES